MSIPGDLVDVDPTDPDLEVRRCVWWDEADDTHARAVKVLGNRFATLWAPAWVVAWARPRDDTSWRWVLLVWQDKPPGSRRPQEWRAEWVKPEPTIVQPLEWSEHASAPAGLAEALVEALDALA